MATITNKAIITKAMIDAYHIPLVDTDEELFLYCYKKENDRDDPKCYNLRGIVIDKQQQVVIKGLPYCTELVLDADNNHQEMIDLKTAKMFVSYEGTVIRVFHYAGKWYTSTNKRLNAFSTKWGAVEGSFGDSFATNMRRLFPSLSHEYTENKDFLTAVYNQYMDKEKCYSFLLFPSKAERIVYSGMERILHLETSGPKQQQLEEHFFVEDGSNLSNVQIHTNDWDEVTRIIKETNPYMAQGMLFITEDGRYIKIYNERYFNLYMLRGNVPSIRFRYLELRNMEVAEDFIRLYPEFDWKAMEEDIKGLCFQLHSLYMQKYVRKYQVETNSEYEKALTYINGYYLIHRQPIYPSTVHNIISQKPSILNKLVRKYKWAQKQANITDIEAKIAMIENITG
jgi:hypothetical protein